MSTDATETTATLPAVTEETVTMPVAAEAAGPAPCAALRAFPRYPIGDALIGEMPGFDIPGCGHCGTVFADATPAVLTAVRPLMEMRHLAYEAGWGYDLSLIWTCPACKQAAAERVTGPDRAEAEAAADAEHEHRAILAAFDLRAERAMAAKGGEFTCRWSYEDAAPGWAA